MRYISRYLSILVGHGTIITLAIIYHIVVNPKTRNYKFRDYVKYDDTKSKHLSK